MNLEHTAYLPQSTVCLSLDAFAQMVNAGRKRSNRDRGFLYFFALLICSFINLKCIYFTLNSISDTHLGEKEANKIITVTIIMDFIR